MPATPLNYRADIQGLRAVAVLAVIIFHLNTAWLPGGFVGVDIFMVISGYLIGGILLSKKLMRDYKFTETTIYFYSNRFKRIVPAYLTALTAITLIAAALFVSTDFSTYRDGLKDALLFNSNNYFSYFGDYFAPSNHEQLLLHTWSISIEVQFYLIAPFVFLLVPKQLLRWLLPTAVILLTMHSEYRLQQGITQETYYSFISRLPAFFLGGWVALLQSLKQSGQERSDAEVISGANKSIFYLATGLIALAFWMPKPIGHFPGAAGLVPASATAMIIWIKSNNKLTALLSLRPIAWLGKISYSLYLWHWPVLAMIRYVTGIEKLDFKFTAAFVGATLAISTASYYCVESPLRKKINKELVLCYVCLVLAILVTVWGARKINAYATLDPLSIEYLRYADDATICHGKIVGDCLRGDLSSTKEVLVLGDSHAAMLNHFFDYLGKELGFKARIITSSSCVTIPKFDYQRVADWALTPCLTQIQQAERYLVNAPVIFVAAAWHYHLPSEDFRNSLISFLNSQGKSGSRVYIFEQVPLLSKNPLRAMRFKSLGMEPIIEVSSVYLEANIKLRSLSAGYPGVTTLNFESTGAFSQVPFANGLPIYYDQHHLNEIGARHYAANALDSFRRIID